MNSEPTPASGGQEQVRPTRFSLTVVQSSALHGVDGYPVRVEVHVTEGLPGFTIVGLPDAPCRETRDRVRAAILSSQLVWPTKRITVNLAPPVPRKLGTALDLPIALGILIADGQLSYTALLDRAAVGELGLDGRLRPVAGAVPLIAAVTTNEVLIPADMVADARRAGQPDRTVRAADDLATLVATLRGDRAWPPPPPRPVVFATPPDEPDAREIRGQAAARHAVEVAAAGGHHLLMVGPPSSGKTALARRLRALLPDLTPQQAWDVTRVHSVAGLPLPPAGLIQRPPFRNPHVDASAVSLIGGATSAMLPGEVSLAHHGTLFLNELGEFSPAVLENLRQSLEEGVIRLTRAASKVMFPAQTLVVGAMDPCPCGEGATSGDCRCSSAARTRYSRRLSVRLLDRFDLRVEIARPTPETVSADTDIEPVPVVAARVAEARQRANARGVTFNRQLSPESLETEAPLSPEATRLVEHVLRVGRLTGRGLAAIQRVALTMADLAGDEPPLGVEHVSTALALRSDLSSVTGRTG